MKEHSCLLPPMIVAGLFTGPDGRRWNIRLATDAIEEMNEAAKKYAAEMLHADKQGGKGEQKLRGNYHCNFCLYNKAKSEFHRKHCILRPKTKVTLGGEGGKTWLHATRAGRASNSKAVSHSRFRLSIATGSS
jgi:hypothetical protein